MRPDPRAQKIVAACAQLLRLDDPSLSDEECDRVRAMAADARRACDELVAIARAAEAWVDACDAYATSVDAETNAKVYETEAALRAALGREVGR